MSEQRPGATSILQAVERRGEADAQPSYFVYVILPLLIMLAGVAIFVGALFAAGAGVDSFDPDTLGTAALAGLGLLVVAVIAGIVLTVMGLYKLIKRRNLHFQRDQLLRQGTLELCRDADHAPDEEALAKHLEAMERIHNESQLEENERSPALHLILYFLIPFWNWYVLYFLLKDIPRHSRRQARFTQHANEVLTARGQSVQATPAIQEHSFLLAMLVTVIFPFWTFVVMYWVYTDPNKHFANQWQHEDALVTVARTPPEPAPDEPAEGDAAAPAKAPSFTVWACDECNKRYKVPPKRPVRVTCKNCGNQAVLRD